MTKLVSVCLLVVGLINFAPLAGVLSAQSLERAYGVTLASNDLIILMRHRALLFGLLGGFVLYSVFAPGYRTAAITMAGISMVGFAVLAHLQGEFNASLNKVLIADYIGIVFLVIAVLLSLRSRPKHQP